MVLVLYSYMTKGEKTKNLKKETTMKVETRQAIRRKKREAVKQLKALNEYKELRAGRNFNEGHINFGDYMNLYHTKVLTNNGAYQRPYKYNDELEGYNGNKWQKELIASTLLGDKIPTLSVREINDEIHYIDYDEYKTLYKLVILDGGHRTQTWYSFFTGLLTTPEGFTLEIEGKVYDEEEVGGCSWLDFPTEVKDYLSKNIILNIDTYYNMTDAEAGKKFRKLNNLHNMTDQEKRNSYNTQISKSVREMGATDSKLYEIFYNLNSNNEKFKYLGGGMKVHGRVSDEVVAKLTYIIHNEVFDNIDPDKFLEVIPSKGKLDEMYEDDLLENDSKKSEFHEKSKLIKRVRLILQVINLIIVDNSNSKIFNNSDWTVTSIIKLGVYLNRWMDKYGVESILRMDTELFYVKLNSLLMNKNLKMIEYSRYHVVNGEMVVRIETDKKDKKVCTFLTQWRNSKRIDDMEWVLLVIEEDMKKSLGNWGIIELDPKRFFSKTDYNEIVNRDGEVCNHKGCDVTTELEVDHKDIPWIKGGSTVVSNGQLLCKSHNTIKSDNVNDVELKKLSEDELLVWSQLGRISNEKCKEILYEKFKQTMGIK